MAKRNVVKGGQAEEWLKWHDEGFNYNQIAKKTGFSAVCISSHVRRLRRSGNSSAPSTTKEHVVRVTKSTATTVKRLAKLTGRTQSRVTDDLIAHGVSHYVEDLSRQLEAFKS